MKELWLFTSRFPFGMGESFLENELPVLCARFEKVIIYPEHADGAVRPVPPNAEIRLPIRDPYARASLAQAWRSRAVIFRLLRALWKDSPSIAALRAQWPELRSRIFQLLHRAEVLHQVVLREYDPEGVVIYSYWTHDWVTVLSMVRRRIPKMDFFSRAHGFDLYEAQNRDRWIPFRSFQLEHVSRIYCVSGLGQQHLQRVHPDHKDLFQLSRLGTRDHGAGPMPMKGPLHVVSCSFLIPRKRVLDLVQALSLVRTEVRWTHFGGGKEEKQVRTAAAGLPKNVSVHLHGDTPNSELMKWYTTQPVDVFVHLSALEGGVAVAVQEAASFGIPLICADSGGVRDIVGPRTGLLLPNEIRHGEVAMILDGLRDGPMGTAAFRQGVREAWREGFEANMAFNRFVDEVLDWHFRRSHPSG